MSLRGDRLIVKGKTYTVNNLDTLPENIHPRNMCTVTNDQVLVSGGLLSEYSFLSNYAKCDLELNSVKYETLEHGYGHLRALHFNDLEIADRILSAKNPAEVKQLGYKVKGFRAAEWGKQKEKVMLELLRIKFKAGSSMAKDLQATGNKQLAESGRDTFFSCGLSLVHPDVLDPSKWKSNMLGRLQMKIRSELK